jgi:hypothetical protein
MDRGWWIASSVEISDFEFNRRIAAASQFWPWNDKRSANGMRGPASVTVTCATTHGGGRILNVQRPLFIGRFCAGALAVLLLSSCGNFFPGKDTIVAITILPQSFYVLTSGTAQFTAQGTFGNNSTGDVTSQVSWASSNTSVAAINSSGTATATSSPPPNKLATTTITAKSGSVTSNSAALTVATVDVASISIAASGSQSISVNSTVQFTATATLADADGTVVPVTNIATWTSNNTAVATVNSSGLATAVSTGTATITATLDTKSSNGTLMVTQ